MHYNLYMGTIITDEDTVYKDEWYYACIYITRLLIIAVNIE